MTDMRRRTKLVMEDDEVPTTRRAGARSAGAPNYLVVTSDPSLGFALGRLAQAQHLSVMIYWSIGSLMEAPLLHADALIVDQDLWHELHIHANARIKNALSGIPVIITTDINHPTIAIAADDQVRAVMPQRCGAATILQAAVKAARHEPEL
jgi:DNA-binding NarL/FixJ family response regulator